MAIRAEVKENLLDLIVALIWSNYPTGTFANSSIPTFNVDDYRKIIDPETGEIVTSSPNDESSVVIYQQDYQDFKNTFNDELETIADCYCDGEVVEHECSVDYTWAGGDHAEATWVVGNLMWECICAGGGECEDDNQVNCVDLTEADCGNTGAQCELVDLSDTTIDYFEISWSFSNGCSPPNMEVNLDVLQYLSQILKFNRTGDTIDSDQAGEILDTTIYELLPQGLSRQQRINKFFGEFAKLVGDIPPFDFDIDGDAIPDTWENNVEEKQDSYEEDNSIIKNPETGNIVRLDRHAETDDINKAQTLESLRDAINDHLTDIDKTIDPEISDERPEYEDKAPGYLKIRNLNQSIIIRSQEGQDVGLIGSDTENPKWLQDGFTITMWVKFLDKKRGGTLFNFGNPFRKNNPHGFVLETFTIHKDGLVRDDEDYTWDQWINCKTYWGDLPADEGGGVDWTLWPDYCSTSSSDPLYHGTSFSTHHPYFKDSDWERFIRLVVREKPSTTGHLTYYPKGALRDSHVGLTTSKEAYVARRLDSTQDPQTLARSGEWETGWGGTIPTSPRWAMGDASNEGYLCTYLDDLGYCNWYPQKLLQHLRVPNEPDEWFFIVANYNPTISEDDVLCDSYSVSQNCFYNSGPEACDCNPGSAGSCDGYIGGGGKNCSPNALTSLVYNSDYWKWHIDPVGGNADQKQVDINDWLSPSDPMGKYTHNSGKGARCKVEIISKSELVRAQGYQPEKS